MTLYVGVFEATFASEPGNPFVNAFMYDVNDVLPSSGVAFALASEIRAQLIDNVAGWSSIVTVAMNGDRVVVTTPFDPTVLGIVTMSVPGTRIGAAMPRFVSWGFKSERTRADIRAGFKRFGTISETDTAGQIPTAGMLTLFDAFQDQLNMTLSVDDGITTYSALPVIVKRIPYITESGSTAYRLPNSPLEYQFSPAQNWDFQAITSQNSRKP